MHWTRCLALPALLAVSPLAFPDPLYVRNLAPVAGLVGFPVLRSATVLAPGKAVFELNSSAANTQNSDSSDSEAILLDGETWRVAPRVRYGFAADWEVEAELPWLRHSGGELDALIESWHDTFGLPDGDRNERPRDQLVYAYSGPGAGYNYAHTNSGLGDASVALVRRLWSDQQSELSVRGQVKFASGDKDKWLGSGSEDYSLGVNLTALHAPGSAWWWHGQAGYTRAGKIEQLEDTQERNLWFAGMGLEWRGWQKVQLKMQLDAHAAPANSALTQIGDPAVQFSAGLSWLPTPGWELDFSFSEDIAVDTAADIVFQLGIRYRK
jgi:hypothetical protein